MRRIETSFLQAGCCRHPEAMTLSGGRLSSIVFPALAGVLVHPQEGVVLFDTGYDRAFLTATEPFPERLYRWLTPPTLPGGGTLAQGLGDRGYSVDDVSWVVLSHFHGDHVAGLPSFPKARIACARAGLTAARAGGRWGALVHGVLPSLIPTDIEARARFFEDCPTVPLPPALGEFGDGADLFGDGSVLAVELPGHCPGHWGLVVRGEDDRLNLMAGDAAWSSRAIREDRPPPSLTTALLGTTGTYRQTLHRLHRLHCEAPEVLITPAHCVERAAQIEAAAGPCAAS